MEVMKNTFFHPQSFFSPPNTLSLLNLFSGFLSLLMAARGDYHAAAWLIPLAMLWDSLDGNVARMFKMSSQFGRELDSLADMVSFVAAPPFLMFQLFAHESGTWLLPVTFFYLMAGTYRLARFNTKPPVAQYFEGLPSPAAAAVFSLLVIAQLKNRWFDFEQFEFVALCFLLVISFLMVSKIRYPKLTAVKFSEWKFFYLGTFLFSGWVLIAFGGAAATLAILSSFLVVSPVYAVSVHTVEARPAELTARH